VADVFMRKKMGIFALKTTSNREDQVFDFISSNVSKRGLNVFSVIRPHGLRGYIFVEADSKSDVEESYQKVPYARGLLHAAVDYKEIEHMLEQVKVQMDIRKNDIVEIISGPFKREQAKVTRIDQGKEEVVVELLEAAVPIPITVKLDSVKVVRRDNVEEEKEEKKKVKKEETFPEEAVEIKESVEEVMKESEEGKDDKD